jgi:hypothetical protein
MLNIDVKLRYLPMVKIIKKTKRSDETILEVGGGALNLSR